MNCCSLMRGAGNRRRRRRRRLLGCSFLCPRRARCSMPAVWIVHLALPRGTATNRLRQSTGRLQRSDGMAERAFEEQLVFRLLSCFAWLHSLKCCVHSVPPLHHLEDEQRQKAYCCRVNRKRHHGYYGGRGLRDWLLDCRSVHCTTQPSDDPFSCCARCFCLAARFRCFVF